MTRYIPAHPDGGDTSLKDRIRMAKHHQTVPLSRAFVATVITVNGMSYTSVVHGTNPTVAEATAKAQNATIATVVVRSELH